MGAEGAKKDEKWKQREWFANIWSFTHSKWKATAIQFNWRPRSCYQGM